jgi:hypothetical protein
VGLENLNHRPPSYLAVYLLLMMRLGYVVVAVVALLAIRVLVRRRVPKGSLIHVSSGRPDPAM